MRLSDKVLFNITIIIFLSVSIGFASDKKTYPTSPPSQPIKKCHIVYLEGGPYKTYPKALIATVEGLIKLGWIETIAVSHPEKEDDTSKLWSWLASNVKSRYLEFAADAYYSADWKNDVREQMKKRVLKRLKETRDIDLMLAFGTWAGQDLANNEHSVPTLVCSVSDALSSKIVKSAEDSGYDHIHARLDPNRYQRQIRAFHDVIGFKKLGVAFENSEAGKSYAAIADVEKVAKERKFEIIPCYYKEHDIPIEAAEAEAIRCSTELAPKIDAFYITLSNGVTRKSLPTILDLMNAHKIPTFSQFGSDEVRQGVLLSVATPDINLLGRFHAETIAKVINGAKPRELEQIFELPMKSAFNAATAKKIGLKPEIYDLLLRSSTEIYKEPEINK